MSGKVEVQSRALRSYKAVVMPTDALLTLGILKLTSLMFAKSVTGRGRLRGDSGSKRGGRGPTTG